MPLLDQEEVDRLLFFAILVCRSLSRTAGPFLGGVEGVILLVETVLSQALVNRGSLCAVFEAALWADHSAEDPYDDRRDGLVF